MEDKLHIVAITALIKNSSKDKFLVLKRHMNEIAYPGKWAFPGGKAEKGETVLETLKREVLEEAGLEIEDYKKYLRDFTFIRSDDKNVIGLCFEVIARSENVTISEDFETYKWIKPEEISDLDCIKGMEKEVELAFQPEIPL